MKPFRTDTIYISDKAGFYAHILIKAKGGNMTKDQLIDAELIDKWENEYPQLQPAFEKNNEIRQSNRKAFELNEAEVIRAISPVPGAKI